MNNVDLMRRAVHRFPFDDAARYAFEDALREDGWRDELAVDSAFKEQLIARETWYLDRAAAFIATRCGLKARYVQHMRSLIGIGPTEPFNHVIVAGCQKPSRSWMNCPVDDDLWAQCTIFVGAEWVLHWRDEWGVVITGRLHTRRELRARRRVWKDRHKT